MQDVVNCLDWYVDLPCDGNCDFAITTVPCLQYVQADYDLYLSCCFLRASWTPRSAIRLQTNDSVKLPSRLLRHPASGTTAGHTYRSTKSKCAGSTVGTEVAFMHELLLLERTTLNCILFFWRIYCSFMIAEGQTFVRFSTAARLLRQVLWMFPFHFWSGLLTNCSMFRHPSRFVPVLECGVIVCCTYCLLR